MSIKVSFVFILMFLLAISINSPVQAQSDNLEITEINRKVKEYPETFNIKTPISSFLTFTYLRINGTDSLRRAISSLSIQGKMSGDNKLISEKERDYLSGQLENTISRIFIYKDSVAGIILDDDGSNMIWWLYFERGVWVNAGEGFGGKDSSETQEIFLENAPVHLDVIRKINQLEVVLQDTATFVNYLKNSGIQPLEFMLDVLKKHKVVLYGEMHFRKTSWNLMENVIKLSEFPHFVGAVFLELSVNAQNELDLFFNSELKNPEIILDVFRKEELTGWDDRGMYEFILDIWDVNKNLPDEKKIKVLAADFPRPFYSVITNKEQYMECLKNSPDRNVCMATIIEQYIDTATDERNCLFIVGTGHAYKSSAMNKAAFQKSGFSAGNLLSEKFSAEQVFSIFTHAPMVANKGYVQGLLRKGIFDYAFANNGDKPVAFYLPDSPFGQEVFDGLTEICFNKHTGTFENNYDGYIFLQPLEEELVNTPLYELYTDDFIMEIKRRATILGMENDYFYNTKIKDLNRNRLIPELKSKEENLRWNHIYK